MFQFCKGNIQNIIFRFISKTDVDNTGVILNERFERVTRIPGIYMNILLRWKEQVRIKNQPTEPAITCSKLTIETLEQGVRYVQS